MLTRAQNYPVRLSVYDFAAYPAPGVRVEDLRRLLNTNPQSIQMDGEQQAADFVVP